MKSASNPDEDSDPEETPAEKKKTRAAARQKTGELVQLYNLETDPAGNTTSPPITLTKSKNFAHAITATSQPPSAANQARPDSFVVPKIWGEAPLP